MTALEVIALSAFGILCLALFVGHIVEFIAAIVDLRRNWRDRPDAVIALVVLLLWFLVALPPVRDKLFPIQSDTAVETE